jgi:hypothetical protein
MPTIEIRYIQECAFKNKIPITRPQISEKLFNLISEIIKNIIPLGILKENIKNQSLNNENIIYRLKEKITGFKGAFTSFKF